ncbi:39S ribosomal protein L11, mitochondrial [Eumeta japonica]|uniref:39S ribosomal protein L11, mitochondrial n=1 Tax=Eumeta variegata TaxID=151549 RepID=A0A4C1ZJF4_EUMVA|nr:39S ribosomal protein L11, mitochondrial [Eumeta japonica]
MEKVTHTTKLKTNIPAGMAAAGPPLGPMLGQIVKELNPDEYADFLEERKTVVEAQRRELQEKREAKMLHKQENVNVKLRKEKGVKLKNYFVPKHEFKDAEEIQDEKVCDAVEKGFEKATTE